MTPRRASRSAAAAAVLAITGVAGADDTPSLALEPAPAGDRALAVERAEIDGHLALSARGLFDFAYHPLSLRNAHQQRDVVVDYQLWLHNLVSLAIFRRALFHVDLPLVVAQAAGDSPSGGATAPRPDGAVAFGDVRLGARLKLYGSADDNIDPKPWDERTELALAARLWLPTGTDGYAGDGTVRGGGSLIVTGTGEAFHWGFNTSIHSRPSEQLPGALPTRVATALGFGASAAFFVDDARNLALGHELIADLTLTGGAKLFDPRATVAHFLLTAAYRVGGGPFEIAAAVGPSFGLGAGAADARGLLSLGYAPEAVRPPPDADGDDIPDKDDACVDLPGDPSADPLLHGCPPPPLDFDGDAIPDEVDACPRVAGVATGVRRTHGCPKDRDGDGVPDGSDVCPDERGPAPPKGDGCPPPKPPALTEERIEIGQQIQFELDTAELRPESAPTLEGVAKILIDHPEVARVEVQGHTDGTGSAEHNRELSQARADAVVAWLVAHGVAPDRLTGKGYGHDRPIADDGSEEGRAKNRRVEFHILERRAPQGEKKSAPTTPEAP